MAGQQFDTIICIDVLEPLSTTAKSCSCRIYLRPGGHIIVLSPAHQRLFTRRWASVTPQI